MKHRKTGLLVYNEKLLIGQGEAITRTQKNAEEKEIFGDLFYVK